MSPLPSMVAPYLLHSAPHPGQGSHTMPGVTAEPSSLSPRVALLGIEAIIVTERDESFVAPFPTTIAPGQQELCSASSLPLLNPSRAF